MSIDRRIFLVAASLAAAAFASPAAAADRAPFDAKAFSAAKAQGRSVLIEVFAPWCPTCQKQKPIIGDLMTKPDFKPLVVYTVDFDKQKNELKALGVTSQSTLIAFKGEKETGRSVGVTDAKAIEALMRSAR